MRVDVKPDLLSKAMQLMLEGERPLRLSFALRNQPKRGVSVRSAEVKAERTSANITKCGASERPLCLSFVLRNQPKRGVSARSAEVKRSGLPRI